MKKRNGVGLALIGIGVFSGVIAEAVKRSEMARLVTCFDLLPERRKACSREYGCDQEKTYEDAVKRKDVDGVLLATPNAAHAGQAVLAALHGKHVFVEKPIANTLADGKRMIEACQKSGVVLMVGHDMRRFAGSRRAKDLIDGGALGRVVMVEGNISSGMGLELTPDKFRWRGDDSGCPGGALMTMGIHHVDMFNYFFGPVKTVSSIFNKLYITADVEDVTTTILQFESGILGYLGSNYASPKTNWVYIYGTKANLNLVVRPPDTAFREYVKNIPKANRYTRLEIFEKGKDGPIEISLSQGDPILEEIEEFAHCIQTGDRPETDGQGALIALASIRAAIESARTGKQIEVKV